VTSPSQDKRPVNLDISTIKLPLAAITSITHRISGLILFVGIAIVLWMFDLSLSGQADFDRLQDLLTNPLVTFIIWGILSALAYHMVAGIKHLLLDLGIGESKEAAPIAAAVVIMVSLLLIVMLGVWLW
jgi:succinate dehydrogenase / fumarate reductase, cytochrome b subunit